MSYKYKVIDCGNVKEICFYHTPRCQPSGNARQKRKNPTSQEVRENNKRHATQKLYYKLCCNFTSSDLYVTVKYCGEYGKAVTAQQMKQDFKRFIRLLREAYRKQGKELKYISVFGISDNSFRHFHMVINDIDIKIIQDCWNKATDHAARITFEHLFGNYDYIGLAKYLVKNGQEAINFDGESFTQLYSCSRNLKSPVITVKTVISRGTFREKIRIDEGFRLIKGSIQSGYDCYGFRFFRYLTIRKE